MAALMLVGIMLVAAFAVAFWDAFVIAHIWNWFAVSAFATVPLSTLQVYGFVLMINVLRYKPSTTETSGTSTVTGDAGKVLLSATVKKAFGTLWGHALATVTTLGLAALVHRLMVAGR